MKKFMHSHYGRIIISIIIGFGLSTLFRKTCKDKECIEFKSPPLDKIQNQVYKYPEYLLIIPIHKIYARWLRQSF